MGDFGCRKCVARTVMDLHTADEDEDGEGEGDGCNGKGDG